MEIKKGKSKGRKQLNLARTTLDDDVAVLTDGTSLLRVGLRGTGISLRLKMVFLIRHVVEGFRVFSVLRFRGFGGNC